MLYLSALLVLFRDGTTELIAETINTAPSQDNIAKVAEAHAALIDSDEQGAQLRNMVARAVLMIDNHVSQRYEFPTAEQAAEETVRAEKSEALRILAQAERQAAAARTAAAALADAEATAARARETLARLSDPKATASADGEQTGEPPPPSGGNGGGNSLLEHLAGLPQGAPVDMLPKPEPLRLGDTVDISEPPTPPAKPEGEAPKPEEQKPDNSAALPQAPAPSPEATAPASPDKTPAESAPAAASATPPPEPLDAAAAATRKRGK